MEFPTQDKPVIIAIKGLPYTRTYHVATQISGWAKSPLFCQSYLLEELYVEGGYTRNHRPSKEEDEHLHRLAFYRLCVLAKLQLMLPLTKFDCVLVESQLSFSTIDLDRLIQLSTENQEDAPLKLIIIEQRMRHKYLWKSNVQFQSSTSTDNKWYFPQSWNEVEDAIRDYDAKAWDEHYHLQSSLHPHLKRLVLDSYLDIHFHEIVSKKKKASLFAKAIEYLLTDEAAPSVVEYRSWRKKLVEGLLTTPSNMMSLCSNSAGDCIFKYTTGVEPTVHCRACEQQVLTKEAYMCVSCNLALHKSCAEFPPKKFYVDIITGDSGARRTSDPVLLDPEMRLYACKSCTTGEEGKWGGFSDECGACALETHLKCRLVPSVVDNTNLHPHSLSIHIFLAKQDYYICQLCSFSGAHSGYYCLICNSFYHVRCAHSPAQVQHEHGGYRHFMKLTLPPPTTTSTSTEDDENQLVFARDDYLDPDDFWCDVCYRDIDSHSGFYACQDCPDYVAHILCISKTWEGRSFAF